MKSCIIHTRIPAGQAAGNFDILLPDGFGVPKGFVVYNLTNSSAYNAFDNGTADVTRSVGFGGSSSSGAQTIRNICNFQYNQYNVNPTVAVSGTAATTAMYDRNSNNTILRSWYATSFVTDKIVGRYHVVGVPTAPVDMVFTVFSGDDVYCAVTGIAVTTTAVHSATTPFQADIAFLMHNRPAQTTDGDLCFGVAHRVTGSGSGATTVRARVSSAFRNLTAQTTSQTQNLVSSRLTQCLSTNYGIYTTYMGTSSIGFTGSGAATGNTIICLAIKGPSSDDFAVGNFVMFGSTGSTTYATNFVPQLVMGGNCPVPGTDTVYTTSANGCETMNLYTATGLSERNINGFGTITASTASATITGTGSSFLFQIGPTDLLKTTDGVEIGTVSSVASNTSLTLTANSAINLTTQNFVFEKSQQFSLGWGNRDAEATNPNRYMYGYTSTNAMIGFTCGIVAATLEKSGTVNDFRLDGNAFSANLTTSTGGNDNGWYVAFKDQNYANVRRGAQVIQ